MRKIIVAPLNWGLGHASRCVPIIQALIENKYTPVLASDGAALQLLRKEFPHLAFIKLPSYQISYGNNIKWSLVKSIPTVLKAVKAERIALENYIKMTSDVVGVISDNRFGMYSSKIPSVYITHQIKVLSGVLTPFTSLYHQRIIKKFDECWIPDEKGSVFSGKLSRSKKELNQKFIGILSRFKKKETVKSMDILIVLSGPEPNRSIIEAKLKEMFFKTKKKVVLVQGVIEEKQSSVRNGRLTIVNYMESKELEEVMNSVKMVICRSGYSSIMDLIALQKKALLIPTKGQQEQEYLAKHISKNDYFPVIDEDVFDVFDMQVPEMNSAHQAQPFDKGLFCLFEGK